jgi:hypothetical protein
LGRIAGTGTALLDRAARRAQLRMRRPSVAVILAALRASAKAPPADAR